MKAVLTGATSFVGAATLYEMLKEGHEVYAIVRPHSEKAGLLVKQNEAALKEGRLHIVENDLSAPEELPEKIPAPCDVFFHFGWGGSGSGARTDRGLQEKNLTDSLNTILAAEALGCDRFIFSGSQAEYGMHGELMTEETSCDPRSLYGEAKLSMREQGEKLCRKLDMSYIHVRIFSAYGPGDHPWTLVESCLRTFCAGGEMSLGACTQKWNFIYITDLAKAMCALAEAPKERLLAEKNPVYNLAGADTRPLREFVEKIHEVCGGRGSMAYATRQENAEGAVNLIPDISKICRVTGWKPEISFSEGIKRTLEYDKD